MSNVTQDGLEMIADSDIAEGAASTPEPSGPPPLTKSTYEGYLFTLILDAVKTVPTEDVIGPLCDAIGVLIGHKPSPDKKVYLSRIRWRILNPQIKAEDDVTISKEAARV